MDIRILLLSKRHRLFVANLMTAPGKMKDGAVFVGED